MAAEAMVYSPSPKKVFCRQLSSPKSPSGLSEANFQDLSSNRPFWYDADERATEDLREVMCDTRCAQVLPDWMPAFDQRCLSSASTRSTCAASPPPFSISPASSPDHPALARCEFSEDVKSSSDTRQPQVPPGTFDKSSPPQVQKVFVGGIPQSVDNRALHHMFSKFGKVKKAWLQPFHESQSAAKLQIGKKHRGFGFVVYHNKSSVDLMLDADFSRFVTVGEDVTLEVKRAVGKHDLPPPASESLQFQQSTAHVSPQTVPGLSAPTMLETGPSQTGPSQMVLVGVAYVNLPCVPPFPSFGPSIVQCSPVPTCDGLTDAQKEELTKALLDAMPEYYED